MLPVAMVVVVLDTAVVVVVGVGVVGILVVISFKEIYYHQKYLLTTSNILLVLPTYVYMNTTPTLTKPTC